MKILLMALALTINFVHAKVVEETMSAPVKVTDKYGKVHAHNMHTLIYYDDEQSRPYRIAIIGHGRAVYPEQRAALKLTAYAVNAKWLARLGFMVAVPARIGYAETGGEDIEDTGKCNSKVYPPAYKAGAEQTLQLLAALRKREGVSQDRGLVMGQSMGGAIAISTAAQNPEGIQLTVNFAGGGGGNPATHPGSPCNPSGLESMFGEHGKTARIATLWVYTANDQWMGDTYPKEWFAAFKSNGGQGEFLALPANGKDGHGVFTRDPAAWRPQVLEVLRSKGLIR
jgi:dienelactone hydrolase